MENLIHLDPNPCVTCGACCVTYRASFHWLELASAGGTVPDDLTEQLTPHLAVMKGSSGRNIRCCALDGAVGERVSCSIYPLRSSPCRDFPYSGENGVYHDRCEKARARVGLPPLMQPPQEPPDSPEGDDPQAPETTPGRAA